jgi:predicted secreted hydrolase
LAIVLPAVVSPSFSIATAPYEYRFPRDHYAHDAYQTEWWYFTGHVRSQDGRRFGFELTFFRIGLEPHAYRSEPGRSRWRAAQLYPAHFAITDEARRQFVYSETFARDALGQGVASQSALDVRANAWSLTGTGGERPQMHLVARSNDAALDLHVVSHKPPAIHGIGGISRKGPCRSCASHYYSFTRLATSGTLTVGGRSFIVEGVSWMDHEFGSDQLQPDQSGWDWFSIQLDDGREIMLYHLRQRNGDTTPESSGSLIAASGGVRYLPLRAFSIQSLSSWRSPHTRASYPASWRVHVDGVEGDLLISPVLDDQELVDATGTTYWEGAADVLDAAGRRHLGVAYVELTGYAAPVRL